MALESKSNPLEEEREQQNQNHLHRQQHEEQEDAAVVYHPFAPPDELFDISTTVDPSYIISLIRKLVPTDAGSNGNSDGANGRNEGWNADNMDESGNQASSLLENEAEHMDVAGALNKLGSNGEEDDELSSRSNRLGTLVGEEVWEEYGCILWDLAASRTHAELMVQNLVLEVLMANLTSRLSVRVTEICLGIIGNLACHEMPMKHVVSTSGLVETVVDQLFLDDTQCLGEAFRVLTLGIQGSEHNVWTKAVQSEDILSHILWIAANTLNPQLLEKSVGLLLAILESPHEVSCVLLPSLIKLGLPCVLINLFSFEMSKLATERQAERYPVLDIILHAIEALSILDGLCEQISSNKELFQLTCDLVKLPDKVEVANSCVTAAVLIANILADVPDLAQEVSQDFLFLQGLFDIFPFTSNDLEARSALWSTIARVLAQVKEEELSPSSLNQYVFVLVSKSDLIEDDLLDQQFISTCEETKTSGSSSIKSNSRKAALQRIVCILNQQVDSKDCSPEDGVKVGRLRDCCYKFLRNLDSRSRDQKT